MTKIIFNYSIVWKKQVGFLIGFLGFGIFLGRIFDFFEGCLEPCLEDLWGDVRLICIQLEVFLDFVEMLHLI